jgi:hypothetical protein
VTPPVSTVACNAVNSGGGDFTPAGPLSDGTHVMWVRVHDQAQNQSAWVHYSFTVDSQAPAVAATLQVPSLNGYIKTNLPSFAISSSDAHPGTFVCKLDSQPAVDCHALASFAAPSALAEGSHQFVATATDAVGNAGNAVVNFTVDTVAPVLNILAPTPGQLVDAENPDVNISSPDGAAQCHYDNETYVPCDAAFVNRTLPDGPHTLHVLATDAAGNSTERSVDFTIDAFLGSPPKPQTASFSAGKAKKGKSGSATKRTIKVLIVPPDGTDPATACTGPVTLSVSGKLGKKSKTYQQQTDLEVIGSRCAASASFSLPKKFKNQKLTTKIAFKGNAVLSAFTFTGTIKN